MATKIRFNDIEDVLNHINPIGKFQIIITAAFCLMLIPVAYPILVMYFIARDSNWRCAYNSTICNLNGSYNSDNSLRCHLPRVEWEYVEKSSFSLITQYDLNCQRESLIHTTTSMIFLGWAIGAIPFGWLVDNYGRKKTIFSALFCIISLSLISVMSPSIVMLMCIQFVVGVFVSGSSFQMYVWASEFTTTEYRSICVNIIRCFFPIGWCVLALKAYFVQEWKHLVIVCSAPYLVLLVFVFVIPESIRWLHIQQKSSQLVRVVHYIANCNSQLLPENISILPPLTHNRKSSNITVRSNPSQIFQPINLAIKTMVLGFAWLVLGMVQFGLAFAANDLGGSIYLNFILLSLSDIPGLLAQTFFQKRFGHKKTVCISTALTGISCCAIAFIPTTGSGIIARVICAIVGKMSCLVSFASVVIWCLEAYPTKVRAQAMGFFQVMGRVGGAISPWVVRGLRHLYQPLPFLVMGVSTFLSAVFLATVPEIGADNSLASISEEESELVL